jgi:hypothetical protein
MMHAPDSQICRKSCLGTTTHLLPHAHHQITMKAGALPSGAQGQTTMGLVTVHGAGRGRRRFSSISLVAREDVSPKTSSVPLCFQRVNAYWDCRNRLPQRRTARPGLVPQVSLRVKIRIIGDGFCHRLPGQHDLRESPPTAKNQLAQASLSWKQN